MPRSKIFKLRIYPSHGQGFGCALCSAKFKHHVILSDELGPSPAMSRRSGFFSIAAVQPGLFSIAAIQSKQPTFFRLNFGISNIQRQKYDPGQLPAVAGSWECCSIAEVHCPIFSQVVVVLSLPRISG
jgi:hypothetical protein